MNAPLSTVIRDEAESTGLVDPVFGPLEYVAQIGPRPAHWRGVAQIAGRPHRVRLSIAAASRRPTEAQQALWLRFQKTRQFFFAASLVLLKPAFAHYVRDQSIARSLIDEFPLEAVAIPPAIDPRFDEADWSLTYGCASRRDMQFEVRLRGMRATTVLVDLN